VVDAPTMAPVEVFVTVTVFDPVDNMPLVKFKVLAILTLPERVTPRALLTITPPDPVHVAGNSGPVVCAVLPLYCRVAELPYVGIADTVAAPSMENIPFTINLAVVIVFVPEVEHVRLLKVVDDVPPIVCAVPLKFTVLALGVNVPPLFVQFPLTFNVLDPEMVKVAPELMIRLLQTAPALITG
jgi:hypothetical protein